MWQPDGPIEVMAALVALLTNAGRLAEDLQLWATAEFGFVELSDRHSRISIIMPQKKNPYSLTFVRGAAREMMGRLVSAAAHQATPSGQIDNRIFAYGDVPHALEQTRQAVQLLAGTVAGLTINREVMAQRAGQNYSGATDLTEIIMLSAGLDTSTAHRIVGQAVRLALESDSPLTAEILDRAAQTLVNRSLGLSDQTITEAMNPQAIVHTRIGPGGAAPEAVQAMIAKYQASLAEAETWHLTCEKRLAAAEARLLQRAQSLAS
jgi:argininosuccinate lyase